MLHRILYSSCFACLLLLTSCGLFDDEVVPVINEQEVIHLAMGNPSDAQESEILIRNYLIQRPQYALAYDGERGIPTWVSWNLTQSWLGSVSRSDDFLVDFLIPNSITRTSSQDYTGSGFDRGHNCPSADRTLTRRDNEATFYMSNIIPQAPEHNQNMWREMEQYTRDLVRDENKEVYIIMGNYGEGGEGRFGKAKRIGDEKQVAVPANIWKVLVVLEEEGDNDVLRVGENTRIVAVLTPNINDQDKLKEWHEYRVSVDEIERETGLDLLSELTPDLQAILEARVDEEEI